MQLIRSFSCFTHIKLPDQLFGYDSGHFDPGDNLVKCCNPEDSSAEVSSFATLSSCVTACYAKEQQIYLKYNHKVRIRLLQFRLSLVIQI